MAINISHPTNTIDGQDVLNLKSGNSENIELSPDSGLVNVNGDINITGNFRVQGTTTTVNSTTTTIVDPIIALGTDEDGNPVSVNDGKDRGISFFYNNGSNKTGFFGFDSSNNDFRFIPNATITNEVVSGADGTITINRLNSVDIYTNTVNATSTITASGLISSGTGFTTGGYLSVDGSSDLHDTHVIGDLTVDNNTTTTTLDAGDLNITTNVISSDISGDIVLDPGSDSINVSNSNIINLADPTADQHAATKKYVDEATNAISILNIAGDFGTGTVDLELSTFTLNGTTYQIETTVSNDVITFSLPATLIAPGTVEVTSDLTVKGDAQIDGNLNVDGNITLGGNITIGDQTIDTVSVVADFTSNLIPQTNLTYDLGSSSKKWNNLYVGTVTGNVTGQVTDLSNHSTSDLAEGTRLYYTTARTRADVNAGTGLTYTQSSGEFKITDTGVDSGTYGDSSTIPIITINDQGQITAVSTTSVAGVTAFDYNTSSGDLTIDTADGGSYVATVTLDPFTTTNLLEGNNLYYTTARFDTRLATKTTTDLTEGTNLYYTTARVNTDFDSRLATKTTTDLTEGTNLYYTTERVLSELSAGTGVHYDDTTGEISIGQAVETTSNVTFNDVLISGNLTVQGTTTSVNSTTVDIADLNLTLAKGSATAAEANGAGITVDGANATITYLAGTDSWNINKTLNVTGDISTTGSLSAPTFIGDLTGNVTGDLYGNADTATALQTARNIQGVSFDGTSDITVVTAGTGITVDGTEVSIGQPVATTDDVTFYSVTVTTNTTTTTLDAGDLNIIDNVISSDVSGDIRIESGSDNIELVGNTNVTGDLNVSGMIYGDLTGNVTGQVSDLSNHSTSDLAEGTRLYYTTARTRADVNAGTGLTYTQSTGSFEITDTGVTAGTYGDQSSIPVIVVNAQGQITSLSTTSVAGVTDFTYDTTNGDLTISTADGNEFVATVTLDPFTTSNLVEGTNKYYTSQRVRDELSATTSGTGHGDLQYNSATGIFTLTKVSVADVRGDISATTASGVSYNSSTGIISLSNIPNSSLTNSDITINSHTISLGGSYTLTTDDISEGLLNKYYTSQRVRNELSATKVSGDGNFTYNNTSGVFSYTGPSASETQAHFTAGTGLTYNAGEFKITDTNVNFGTYGSSTKIPQLVINAQGQITSATEISVAGVSSFDYNTSNGDLTIGTADGNSFVATVTLDPFTTTDLQEGSNQYYLDSRARAAISVTNVSGDGSISYNDVNGVISYTGPDDSEIRSHFTAGTGVHLDYGTGVISIGQEVETTSNVEFNNVDTVTLDAGNLNITTNVISSDISGDIVIDSGSDNIELIGNTNVTGDLNVSANTIIYGDLTVQGTTTSINTTDTEITDNIITLNQGETGAGVSKGTSGIEVARGSLFNASWKWNEITGRWEAKEGSNLTAIAVAEIDAGNVNIANNTIAPTNTNGDLNLNSNGTGQVLINGKKAATDTDALMYAIVFGG